MVVAEGQPGGCCDPAGSTSDVAVPGWAQGSSGSRTHTLLMRAKPGGCLGKLSSWGWAAKEKQHCLHGISVCVGFQAVAELSFPTGSCSICCLSRKQPWRWERRFCTLGKMLPWAAQRNPVTTGEARPVSYNGKGAAGRAVEEKKCKEPARGDPGLCRKQDFP